jgi:serine phosphatase RsbU (regulator of sigma subunit)
MVLVDDLAEYQHDEPPLLEDVRASGVRSAAAVPLLDASGQPVGVLGLAWLTPTTLDTQATMIRTVAELCGKTLERARAADRRHALIVALQRRLLPEPPSVPGLRIFARYQPAAAEVGMGGDWYQFLPQSDGSLLVVIGDVVGHGVEAITVMAQLQHIIAAAVHTGVPLPKMFAHAHAAMDVEPDNATVQVVRVDPARERIGYLSAGHPYPLLRRPDGTVTPLSDAQHPMLGISAATPTDLATVDFPPGSMALLYTDGLIERRNRPITEGIQALREEFARLRPDDPTALDGLIAACRAADVEEGLVDDDIAVVLLIADRGRG